MAEIIQKGLSAGGKLEDILQNIFKEQGMTPPVGVPLTEFEKTQFDQLGEPSQVADPFAVGTEFTGGEPSAVPIDAFGAGVEPGVSAAGEATATGAGLHGLAGAGVNAALALPGLLKSLGVDVPKEAFQVGQLAAVPVALASATAPTAAATAAAPLASGLTAAAGPTLGAVLPILQSMFETEILGGGTYKPSREAAGKGFAQGLRVLPSEIEMARTPEDIRAIFGQEVGADPNAPFGIRINPEAAPGGGFYELGAKLGPLARQTADIGNIELALMQMAQQGDPTAKAKLAELNRRGLTEFLGANYGERAPADLQAFQELYTNLGKYTGQPLSEQQMLTEFYGGGGPEFSNIRTALGVRGAGLDPNNPADAEAIRRIQLTAPVTGQWVYGSGE